MEAIDKYFPLLSAKQKKQIDMLLPLYTEWNSQINVVSRKDINNLYLHHVLHSLAIAKVINFKNNTRIFDAGTGGGFPGIPLAILFPDCSFTLADSIGKKIKVVDEISHSIGLKNVRTIVARAEQINNQFDFVVSRAVTSLPVFYSWVARSISKSSFNTIKNGILYLKGGDFSNELNIEHTINKVYKIENYFTEEYFKEKSVVHIFRL